jgi:hypothetical protein
VFQLVKAISAMDLFARQIPALMVSLVIADRFYQFHSFVREAGAFLVTWFVIDALTQALMSLGRARRGADLAGR